MAASFDIFGGTKPWDTAQWTASDDRVRGGKSHSYLSRDSGSVRFYGHLDITTLGGAGFASQRTVGEDQTWDLSQSSGIELGMNLGDGKKYTLILKDSLLGIDEKTGREKASISYEYDFVAPTAHKTGVVTIPWDRFKATHRGRDKPDAAPLKTSEIKRFSIMMRSFFGTQSGDFSLEITGIRAFDLPSSPSVPQKIIQDQHGAIS